MQTNNDLGSDPGPAEEDVILADEMGEVANELLRGYLALIERGHHQSTIAEAMLAATVNLFDVLDLNNEVPALLRTIADRLDKGSAVS